MQEPRVARLADLDIGSVAALLADFGLALHRVADGVPIPGSYWGESEAGLVANGVYVRTDTPLHSVFHEASHAIVMGAERRAALERDAGGDYDEENAVCCLQILLADEIAGYGRAAMWSDMDAWGYTFRLGSARAWFEGDAADAHRALVAAGLAVADGDGLRLVRPRRQP
jgi:hypothetical protein